MNPNYIIRHANSSEDIQKLYQLFSEIFPHDVGTLAVTISNYLPQMKNDYWFIAEDKEKSEIASAFALIPWKLEMQGIRLKVAEMGIVGTREAYRNQGLMKILNKKFDQTLEKEDFDLAIIQGIPGFYHHFGFYYSITMENHINLPLYIIHDKLEKKNYSFRLAGIEDIPYMMQEDEAYRKYFYVSTFRDEANWRYLFTDSSKTEYGAEYWIAEHNESKEKYYCRMPYQGFGKGLIISEISACISHDALISFFTFWKQKAIERDKPYIRLNLHNKSLAGKMAITMGAEKGKPYAWQIKIPDKINFLKKISQILEKRISQSCFENFSETIRLDFFKTKIDLIWNQGKLESIIPGRNDDCENTFFINADLFPALSLGHRTWQELQYIRPDIFPASQYLRPNLFTTSDKIGLLMDTLFPSSRSWIYEQY